MSVMPWVGAPPLGPSSEDVQKRIHDQETLQTLAELGELAVIRIAYVLIESRMVAWVRDRNGKGGVIVPYHDHFRSTEKFTGPLAPFTKYCGDGVWEYSIRI